MGVSIEVRHLSKEYKIAKTARATMLQERLANAARRLVRRGPETHESLWALNDVSFQIAEGDVVGIIGRNGAGKSTLLKILSRITYPTGGTIDVRGRVASLLEVGTGFHEELTGRENIFLNGSILGMRQAEVKAKLDAIIDFSGMARFIDTPIKRYSSGMRLRLGFAVAAHLDPDVLIIDEVLAVGDAGFQKKCIDTMRDLRSSGRTVLFVSHNMAAVENLCKRGILIESGRVTMDAPVKEVIDAYMSSFAAAETSAVELLDREGRNGTGDVRFSSIELLTLDGRAKDVVRCGDNLTFRLGYVAHKPVARPVFDVRLYTELGTLITETSTWHHGIEIPVLPVGTGQVELEIHGLHLLPSRYQVSLQITGTGADAPVHDRLEHCFALDVTSSDVYGGGRDVDGRFGIVGFPQKWKMNGEYVSKESDMAALVSA